MPTRAELDRLSAGRRRVVELVQGQLAAFFASLPLNNPERSRDALLEFLPLMVDQFGPVAEQVALEWYEDVRGSGYTPRPGPSPVPRGAIEAKVRYQAGHLFTDNPSGALAGLSASLGKYVGQYSRSAITYNAQQEGVRFARVAKGAKTCAFCLMLVGRSGAWLYLSSESALTGKDGDTYHTKCDCEAIPVEDMDDMPEGHHTREMFEMYRESTDAVGSRSDTSSILADMRRRFPDMLTDGVILKEP